MVHDCKWIAVFHKTEIKKAGPEGTLLFNFWFIILFFVVGFAK